jgi:hypothetical protein
MRVFLLMRKGLALRVVGMYNVYQVWNEARVGHKKGEIGVSDTRSSLIIRAEL